MANVKPVAEEKLKAPRAAIYSVPIQTRVTEALAKRIEEYAAAQALSVSSYVRWLLHQYVPGDKV